MIPLKKGAKRVSVEAEKQVKINELKTKVRTYREIGLCNRDVYLASALPLEQISIEDVWDKRNAEEILMLAEVFKKFYQEGGEIDVEREYPFDADLYRDPEEFLEEIRDNFSLKVDELLQIQKFLENDQKGNLDIGFYTDVESGNALLYPHKIDESMLALDKNQRLKKIRSFLMTVRQHARRKGVKDPVFQIQFKPEEQFPEEDDNAVL